jgi:hypothetical protein
MQATEVIRQLTATTILMPVIDGTHFPKSNRYRAALFNAYAGLPCSDEQKKTRLRSDLSA